MRALQEEEKEEEETTKYGEGDYWDERYGTSKLETLRQNSVLLLVGRQLVHNARSTATLLTTGFLAGEWAQDPYDWLFGARRKWKLREGGSHRSPRIVCIFAEWKDVADVTNTLISTKDRLLLPGCGNAPFSPDMYDAGYKNQVCLAGAACLLRLFDHCAPNISYLTFSPATQFNFDTSTVVIRQCRERNTSRPGMEASPRPTPTRLPRPPTV